MEHFTLRISQRTRAMLESIATQTGQPVSTAARGLLRTAAEKRLVELTKIQQARQPQGAPDDS